MKRRRFIQTGSLALAALVPSWTRGAESAAKNSIATAFDREMETFMAARKIPGGALAVVKNRRLIYARGYGWADREKKIPVQADSLFRIASLSKPITAVAVLRLVEAGRLSLDTKVFPLLGLLAAVASFTDPEPRLQEITIRQLLQHTGGWDREKSFDPMFRPGPIARATNSPPPASPVNIIRYMLSQPLDFDPGTRHAYSNFGYCVLGRVVEKVTGEPYQKFVREKILAPAGITRMRLGGSLEVNRAPGEVHYYTSDGEATEENVFPGEPGKVSPPYGGFHLEAMDAHGGWIASAIDLARFAAALNDPQRSPLLQAETFSAMYAPPPPPVSRPADDSPEASYYACGWAVRPVDKAGKANYWHAGSLPGSTALLVRRADGLSWAALFNQRSEDEKLPDRQLDPALHRAAAAVETWPNDDQFPQWAGR